MKNTRYFLIFILFLLTGYNAKAQDSYIFGANGSYYIPFGSLAERFKPTAGGSFYFGKETSESWAWTGRAEYFKFDKGNTDELFITRKLTVNGVEGDYKMPLPALTVSMEVAGVSAQAEFDIVETNFLNLKGTFAFGLYRWFYQRSAYYDSLFVDTSGTGGMMLGEILDVPASSQTDWSGGFDFGLDVNVNVYGPVWINLGGRYKAVIGEVWPALDLDLENISTFQMFDVRGGIRIKI